jgi:cell division protein ZapE
VAGSGVASGPQSSPLQQSRPDNGDVAGRPSQHVAASLHDGASAPAQACRGHRRPRQSAAPKPLRAPAIDPSSLDQRYRQALDRGELAPDDAQAAAIGRLADLSARLIADEQRRAGWGARLKSALGRRPEPITGAYLHGGVGTGKTHLFDLFYDSLPFTAKLRIHFHRFMFLVHEHLRGLEQTEAPLAHVAAHFAGRARVLCLDEMHVNDITDAMLMYGLLKGLFDRGVPLVTTSNVAPSGLYADGLQREQFEPAIDLLEHHCALIGIDGGTDWRQRNLADAETWLVPPDRSADMSLVGIFEKAVAVNRRKRDWITVNGRRITVVYWADGVAWFDFRSLCRGPRASTDYLEIARFFHTVLLRRIPVMGDADDDAARRFINLIDTLYDRNVRLFASAETEPEAIYTGTRLAFEFQRTASRLREMQTPQYQAQPHLP